MYIVVYHSCCFVNVLQRQVPWSHDIKHNTRGIADGFVKQWRANGCDSCVFGTCSVSTKKWTRGEFMMDALLRISQRSTGCDLLADACSDTHQCVTSILHDGSNIGKVHIDQTRSNDNLTDTHDTCKIQQSEANECTTIRRQTNQAPERQQTYPVSRCRPQPERQPLLAYHPE